MEVPRVRKTHLAQVTAPTSDKACNNLQVRTCIPIITHPDVVTPMREFGTFSLSRLSVNIVPEVLTADWTLVVHAVWHPVTYPAPTSVATLLGIVGSQSFPFSSDRMTPAVYECGFRAEMGSQFKPPLPGFDPPMLTIITTGRRDAKDDDLTATTLFHLTADWAYVGHGDSFA